jgi:L-galactose dehydrogenase
VRMAIQFACSQLDITTTLVSTARPSNIRDNIAYAEEPADESLLAEVREVLKPIHNFNFTRGRLEHRDLLVGPPDESSVSANS